MVRYERTHSPERPDAAVVAAPHHHPPTGHLAGGRVSPSPRLRSRGGEFIGRGFAALVEAPWWAVTSACMALVTATLFAVPANLRVAGDFVIGASALALMTAWAADPATTQVVGTPFWGYLLFFIGIALIDAGYNLQERRARPPRSENGA